MKGEAKMEYVEMVVDFVKAVMEQWDNMESIVIRIIDLVENLGLSLIG